MNSKNLLLVFDFDGVIADSVGALFKVYLEFLSQFGEIGTVEEFSELNGPKIPEIVALLQKKYRFPGSLEDLISRYLQKVSQAYLNLEPVPEAIETIAKLKAANVKMAIASSSTKDEITKFLARYGIGDAFVRILTGEEVVRSKPAPDIYLKLKNEFPEFKLIVVEDSLNGIISAKNAGLNVVAYSPLKEIDAAVDWKISSMRELEKVLHDAENNCSVCLFEGEIEWREIEQKSIFSGQVQKEIDEIWRKAIKSGNLFNGNLFCCSRYFFSGPKLVIEYFSSEYKNFYAQINHPELKLNCYPLAVSGIVIDPCGKTIIGKRQNVTCNENQLELVPSGSLQKHLETGGLDYFEQICLELEEEVGLSAEEIISIKPFCMVVDENNKLCDICCKIELAKELEKCNLLRESREYAEIQIVDIDDLLDQDWQTTWVATSLCILNWLQE
jgi:HAD superfamily hydrolase (TIGR01509 family)